jgi:signal transduction histidine kinase
VTRWGWTGAGHIRRFVGSLTGRIAAILAIGICCAAVAALLVAERARQADFRRVQAERVVASASDVIGRLQRAPAEARLGLRTDRLIGAHLVPVGTHIAAPLNPYLTPLLADRVAGALRPTVAHVSPAVCMASDAFWRRPRAAGFSPPSPPDCWLLAVDQPDGRIRVALDLPLLPTPPSTTTDPVFLLMILAASALLSVVVARLATAPLRRLSAASDAFARSIDAEPVTEVGPSDVRDALHTFNLMQARVREGLRERTRILAAISHDLQTPLTRLRLRLEQVDDPALRDRLVADLSATLAMVRRGLDLARSGESTEDWSNVDLDSLLSSMADDATEFGHAVTFVQGCGAQVRVRPDSLTRCLSNLIDNAVRYAGDAELACRREGREVIVTVRDHGPGMPAALLDRAFEPFVRGDDSRSSGDGSGIGLTIALAQAKAIGAELTLDHATPHGLRAELRLPSAK